MRCVVGDLIIDGLCKGFALGKCSAALKATSSFCNILLHFHWTLVKETLFPCNPFLHS